MRQQLTRFLMVGGLGFLVEALVLQGMLAVGYGPIIARLIGFPLAAITTWLLHRRFTFSAHRSTQRGKELGRYFGAQIFSALLGLALYAVLVIYADPFRALPIAALVIAAAVSTASNFLLSRYVVFTAGSPLGTATPQRND